MRASGRAAGSRARARPPPRAPGRARRAALTRVPIRRPRTRGRAATPRVTTGAGGRSRQPLPWRGSRAGDRRAAEVAHRLGREPRRLPAGEREPRPLVVCAEDERGEDLAAEPARADAVARVARPVVDPRARHGAEERQVVAGDVDRAAPRPLDPRRGQPGQQPAEPPLRARDRRRRPRRSGAPTAAAGADRAGGGAHHHTAVVRRAEVVDEHPAVGDRLAAGPADLREQLGHGLGEDDVAAEVASAGREPAASRVIHAFVATTISGARTTAGCRRDEPGVDRGDARPLVQRDAGGERGPAQGAGRAAPAGR